MFRYRSAHSSLDWTIERQVVVVESSEPLAFAVMYARLGDKAGLLASMRPARSMHEERVAEEYVTGTTRGVRGLAAE